MGALLGAGLSGIGDIVGGFLQAGAVKQAAQLQAQSANRAADLTKQAADNSLGFTKNVFANARGDVQPYQDTGKLALSQLGTGVAPGGEFNQQYDASKILSGDPGYQFRLDQGRQALERAEAAGGSIGGGGAVKAGTQYAQDYASGEYNNAFQRFQQQQQQRFGQLSSLAGLGENANAIVSNAGAGAASNVSNTSLTAANQQGNYLTQAGNANAGGVIGSTNAVTNTLSNLGQLAQQANASGYAKKSGSFSSGGETASNWSEDPNNAG